MAIQMIFCVETNKRADTDSIYITEALRHWYQLSNQIKINKVYMNAKSRYNKQEVLKEIQKKTMEYTIGVTKVIYCIDTDQYEKNPEHKNDLHKISRFCESHGYDLIWFCHDVEEVFLGKKISDSQKVQEAAAFRRKKMIQEIPANQLSSNTKNTSRSNMLCVLDKYLTRK